MESGAGHSPGASRATAVRHGTLSGIDGIAVGLNAIGLLCIGARSDHMRRAAMVSLT